LAVGRGETRGARWALPVGLICAEYLFLSFLVDLTGRTEGQRWVEFYKVAAPVVIGAVAAGWLVARSRQLSRAGPTTEEPPWLPWVGLTWNLAAFALAAGLAWSAYGPSAAGPAPGWTLPALVGLGALAALGAARSVGPWPWLIRWSRRQLGALPAALALGGVTWWVTSSVEVAWGLLSSATLHTVATLLGLAGGEVVVLPEELVVGLGGFEVAVAPVCSGVDGIGLFVLFEAIWLALARERLRFPRALLLLPAGAAAAFGANAVRIAVLIWVGASGHEQVALGGLHSKLGWILSVGLALGSVGLAERSQWLRRRPTLEPESAADAGVPQEVGAYLGPLLAALATSLLTGIWAVGPVDRWYGARIAAALAALAAVRQSLPDLRPSRSWLPFLAGAGVAVAWIGGAAGAEPALEAAVAALGAWERPLWLTVRLVGSIAVIPVIEELAFRGFLLPWLVSPDFEAVPPRAWTWPAVLLSSLAFGALHSQLVLGTLAGLAFAAVRLWRGRLGDAIVAHAVANAGASSKALRCSASAPA